MNKILPLLALALMLAACDGDPALKEPTVQDRGNSVQKSAANSVEPEKLLTDHDRELSDFWSRVRDASAARPDAPKKKLSHVVNTSEGPVVVEVEVVIEEYLRITEEEAQAKREAAKLAESQSDSLSAEEASSWAERTKMRTGSGRLEYDIEASQRRREALEAELQVERERADRVWVVEQLEKDIAAERAVEEDLKARQKKITDADPVERLWLRSRFARDRNGCAPMPFGGGSFGPWDTGEDIYRP